MLKKTFYTVLALGAVITLGITTSAFMSADTTTETNSKAETPFTGTWSAGAVERDGETKDTGTGDWTVEKTGVGEYEVQGPPTAKMMVVTSYGVRGNNHAFLSVGYIKDGLFRVQAMGISGRLKDTGFSFVIYAK